MDPKPIKSHPEYVAALDRISELSDREDPESLAEIETLANFVETWERKQPTPEN